MSDDDLYGNGPQHGTSDYTQQNPGSIWDGPTSFDTGWRPAQPDYGPDSSHRDEREDDPELDRHRPQRARGPSGGGSGGITARLAGLLVSLGGFALAGFLLATKQSTALGATRDVVAVLMPDSWIEPGDPGGFRVAVAGLTVVLLVVLTLARLRFTTAEVRKEEPREMPRGVFLLTLARSVVLVEGFVLLFLAQALVEPSWPDTQSSYVGPTWSWNWFVFKPLPWVLIVLILLGASYNSTSRALKWAAGWRA
ncbi:hypothetical protein ACQPYE_28250 [Actinosynnema sp. CA-299493]